jgi:chromosome segregation ATPase
MSDVEVRALVAIPVSEYEALLSENERLRKDLERLREERETWKDRANINGMRGFEYQAERDQLKKELEEKKEKYERTYLDVVREKDQLRTQLTAALEANKHLKTLLQMMHDEEIRGRPCACEWNSGTWSLCGAHTLLDVALSQKGGEK